MQDANKTAILTAMVGFIAIPLIYTAFLGGDFVFPDFASRTNLNLAGDARVAGTAIRLTEARRHLAGALWFREPQPVAKGFETEFRFQLTKPDGQHFAGADGFAFVLQTVGPNVVAGQGGAAGFAVGEGQGNSQAPGIARSLAIFFDTFQNTEFGDPSNNYIAICTNGDGYWPPRRLAFTRKLPINLKDGKAHSVRIVYAPPQLSVFLDGRSRPVLGAFVQLASVADSKGDAYVGFTAATGNGYQNHDILNWRFGTPTASESSMSVVTTSISFNRRPCLPNRTLCTPDQAMVEERGTGQYHVVVPANMEWSASVPNPEGRKPAFSNVIGTVCRDPRTTAANVCSDGSGAIASKFDAGRTYFSIPGTDDRSEGYLEFDVKLQ